MGMMVDGKWLVEEPPETGTGGEFKRIASALRSRITADGSSGFKAEAGRYHLYVGYHCPWAHRTIIFRALKKLDHAISISYCLPWLGDDGWTFEARADAPDCTADEVNGFHYLHEAYAASDPHYTGKVTVPTLWDKKTKKIVNNESAEIIRMLNSEFTGIAGNDFDYYPQALRPEIDAINDFTYANINNGVYRCGFARSQQAYDEAYDALFAALDRLEGELAHRRYLVGDQQTEADWRLFPTLMRFDVAYFPLFKCNRQRLSDFRNLWRYARDLYATPGIAATVKPRLYVMNYYSLERVNPSGIIPKGTPVDFSRTGGVMATAKAGTIRVGIGGWTFAPWRGTFYPDDLAQKNELAFASRHLTAIEINGTYYRTQTPASFRKWAAETPEDFVFAVKALRFCTNRRMLAEAGESVERFLNSGLTELGAKLGPILWQFAPTKQFQAEDFAAFLDLLPKTVAGVALRHAVEVRHDSFCDAAFVTLLRKAGVAVVLAESEKYPMIADLAADFVYARLQGTQEKIATGYSAADLDLWAHRAKDWAAGRTPADLPYVATAEAMAPKRDAFVFMISGAKVRAPAAAMALMERIGTPG